MGLFKQKSIEELKEEAKQLQIKLHEKRDRKALEKYIKEAKKEISPMHEVKKVANKFLDAIAVKKGESKTSSGSLFSSPLIDRKEGKTLSPILDDLLDKK